MAAIASQREFDTQIYSICLKQLPHIDLLTVDLLVEIDLTACSDQLVVVLALFFEAMARESELKLVYAYPFDSTVTEKKWHKKY